MHNIGTTDTCKMAGPNKRRAIRQEDAESSEDESESSSNVGGEEIQADFEGRNPEGQDFHGIKQLLQQLFLKAHLDLSQLADMLIAQTGVGSVLKQSAYDDEMNDEEEEDDLSDPLDVFGITSVINLSSHKETACVQQLLSLISELCKKHSEKSVQTRVEHILSNSKRLGLLINERFVNIPAKISDPLLTSLASELDRIKKKDTSYDFQYFIMVCKLHKSKQSGGEIVFANAEEEIFSREAKVSFEFSVAAQSDTSVGGSWREDDVEMIPFRRILFIDGQQFNNILQQVKIFVA